MHLRSADVAPLSWRVRLGPAIGTALLLVIVGYGVAGLFEETGWGVFLAGVGLVAVYVRCRIRLEQLRLRRLAAEREGDSICTFVREFDCRAFDTWVLRATYEQLTEYVGFAVCPRDRLTEDLGIDDEDQDDLVESIARLAGRSFDATESNPWFGRVRTVADVCDFMMYQPRMAAMAA